MKKGKPFNEYTQEEFETYRHNFIKNTLRRASYRWPWRNMAITEARVARGLYRCANCLSTVGNKDKKADHIEPVVRPERGFEGWGEYTNRLYVGLGGFQVLCVGCHSIKTRAENEQRKAIRAERRGRGPSKAL